MRIIASVVLILISLAIIALVLMQQKGGGAGAIFGGGGEVYRSKRGVEKIFHYITILLAILFSVISFSFIFMR